MAKNGSQSGKAVEGPKVDSLWTTEVLVDLSERTPVNRSLKKGALQVRVGMSSMLEGSAWGFSR